MDLEKCRKRRLILKCEVDDERVHALVKMSEVKCSIAKNAPKTENDISVYVAMAYDSLREALDALCLNKGFKVLSHDCTGKLVQELTDDFDILTFEKLKFARNRVNYYGTNIEFEYGEQLIKESEELLDWTLSIIAAS